MVPECSRVRAVRGTRVSPAWGGAGGRVSRAPLSPLAHTSPPPLPAPVAPIIPAHLPAVSLMQGPGLGAPVTAAPTVTLLPFLALATAMQGS